MLTWKMDLDRVILSLLFVAQLTEWLLYVGYQKKLDRVIKSPLASETLALSEAAKAGVVSKLQETFRQLRLPEVLCQTDNASLVETLESSNLVSDQYLRSDVARVKEMMAKKEIQTEWIKGREQVAGCLT